MSMHSRCERRSNRAAADDVQPHRWISDVVAPPMTGVKTMLATSGTVVTGRIGTTSGSATGLQAFADLKAAHL